MVRRAEMKLFDSFIVASLHCVLEGNALNVLC
jgi:hypothetical protein